MKDLCQKWKVKLIFRGPETVWSFDGQTWLTLNPIIYDRCQRATEEKERVCKKGEIGFEGETPRKQGRKNDRDEEQ